LAFSLLHEKMEASFSSERETKEIEKGNLKACGRRR
jgi:hypothetical protein